MADYRLLLTKDRPDLSSERADPSVTALARTSSNRKLQTRTLVRGGTARWQAVINCLKEFSRRGRSLSRVPDGRLTTGRTDRLIVGRNVTLT
jgi:hypothetical protein